MTETRVDTELEYYRHSGRFSLAGVHVAMAAGAAAGIVMGIAYAALVKWVPIIYADVALCVAFGFMAGFLPAKLMAIVKTRNAPLVIGLSLAAALVAYVASWEAWVYFQVAIDAHKGVGPTYLLVRPGLLWRLILLINRNGTWSLGSGHESAVSGIALWGCWIIEAGIFFCFVGIGAKVASSRPFCEACGHWCPHFKCIGTVSLPDPSQAMVDARRIARGELDMIPARGPRTGTIWLSLAADRCMDCGQTIALTICLARFEAAGKGKTNTRMTKLVDKVLLTPEAYEQLEEAFREQQAAQQRAVSAPAAPLAPPPPGSAG